MVTKTAPAASIGALIDRMWAVREQQRGLEKQIGELDQVLDDLDNQLRERMGEAELDKATGAKASASISTTVVADVQDWDKFWTYILKNKYTHLLQRRVSDPAYRELLNAGKKVPGVQPFVKKRVNLRTL